MNTVRVALLGLCRFVLRLAGLQLEVQARDWRGRFISPDNLHPSRDWAGLASPSASPMILITENALFFQRFLKAVFK